MEHEINILVGTLISKNPLPSFHPRDLLFGAAGAVIIRAVVYFKAKNAKKYRHGVEYGSARWGNSDDIKPFINPQFDQNILLTQTERVMVGRNKIPKYNINKNVLVIGGSGSGKLLLSEKEYLQLITSGKIKSFPNQDLKKCKLKEGVTLVFDNELQMSRI